MIPHHHLPDIQRGTRSLATGILRWYSRNARALPWRKTHNPYRILVAEIMLQQTQADRVRQAYVRFLKLFPTLQDLAAAVQRDVVIAWRGLGYNNRAVRLHRLAQELVYARQGSFPRDQRSLLALPGVGRYTAHALLAFAFLKRVPVVDINVRRVLSRLFWTITSPSELRPEHDVWDLASRLLPPKDAYTWNQALMDLGATVCTARRPHCGICTCSSICPSRPFMQRSPIRRHRREPSFHGVPHRIYRGRIVERLRQLTPGESVSLYALGKRISSRFTARNKVWLARLVHDLEKDGLVRVTGNRKLHSSRVSLA